MGNDLTTRLRSDDIEVAAKAAPEAADALDAKDAEIARLERERDGYIQAIEAMIRDGGRINERIEDAEAERDRLRDALQKLSTAALMQHEAHGATQQLVNAYLNARTTLADQPEETHHLTKGEQRVMQDALRSSSTLREKGVRNDQPARHGVTVECGDGGERWYDTPAQAGEHKDEPELVINKQSRADEESAMKRDIYRRARTKALEEAARVADDIHNNSRINHTVRMSAFDIARRIRNLTKREPTQ